MKRRLPSRRSPERCCCLRRKTALQAAAARRIGQLAEPQSKFLIIDGNTACGTAAFYLDERPDDAKTITCRV